jgi:hypothetical protein
MSQLYAFEYAAAAKDLKMLDPARYLGKYCLNNDPIMSEKFNDNTKSYFIYYDQGKANAYNGAKTK